MPRKTIKRRRFLAPVPILAGAAFILLVIAASRSNIGFLIDRVLFRKPACKNCNVVVMSLDTLSALHLPCYGYDKNTAPALCSFAKRHIFFPNSYANSYFTLPGHVSLFTSQYPSTHTLIDVEGEPLDPSSVMIQEILRDNGYSTLYFGPVGSEMFPENRGVERGFDYIEETYDYDREFGLRQWEKGIGMLKENDRKGKPTYLFLHTYYVHEPYLPGTRNLHFSNDNVPELPVNRFEYFTFDEEAIAFAKAFFRQNPPSYDPDTVMLFQRFMTSASYDASKRYYEQLVTDNCSMYCIMPYYFYESIKHDTRKVAYMKALYDELILQLDGHLANIFDSLEPMLQKNTILVITADHGQAFNEHGTLFHRSLYNEVLRVPLIISVPKVRPRTVTFPVDSIDVLPTVLRMLGLPRPASAEGADISDAVLGHPFARGKPFIFSERFDSVPAYRAFTPVRQRSLINGRWKLYETSLDSPTGSNIELYDVKNDPWDTTNVADKHPSVVQNLIRQLGAFGSTHAVTFPAPYTPPSQTTPTAEPQRYFHY